MPPVTTALVNQPVWFDLSTSDHAGALKFYSALFGWRYDDMGAEMGHYTMAKVDGRAAAAIAPQMPGMESIPVAWTMYFGVADMQAATARVREHGGTVTMGPMEIPDTGHMCICTDPVGAVFGLWQATKFIGAEIAEEHGTMAWAEVNSTDVDRAREFYGKVFDLTSQRMADPVITYYTLHNGEPPVAGAMQMMENMQGVPPHWLVYFVVADLENANAAVKANGGKLLDGPIPSPYGDVMVVQDPQGGTFAYIAPPPGQ